MLISQSMTSHINHLITSHQTEHAETIATIVKQPEQMVKAIQEKLEPWKTYLKENPDDPSEIDTVVNGRGIPRIRREKEVDGLVRLEQQADVVVCLNREGKGWTVTVTDDRKHITNLNKLD